MGVEINNCNIILDNPRNTYFAGQTINGTINFNTSSNEAIKGIKLSLLGEAKTYWVSLNTHYNSHGHVQTNSAPIMGSETYFKDDFFIVGSDDSEINLQPGNHTYSFNYQLPTEIPSSFESQYGHIRYSLKVTFLEKFYNSHSEKNFKLCFTVISPVDLNLNDRIKQSVLKEDSATWWCCCFESGPLTLACTVPVTGYVSGQKIPITIECDNASSKNLSKISIKLKKIETFIGNSQKYQTRSRDITIAEFSLSGVQPGSSQTWTRHLDIPPTPATDLDYCNIINLNYEIEVKAITIDTHIVPSVTIPIVIGTIPLMSFFQKPPSYDDAVKMPPPDYSRSQGGAVGWNFANPEKPNPYSDLPPPVYAPFLPSVPSLDEDDGEHTYAVGGNQYSPHYPTFMVPTAPVQTENN